jgi:hypothetical protein
MIYKKSNVKLAIFFLSFLNSSVLLSSDKDVYSCCALSKLFNEGVIQKQFDMNDEEVVQQIRDMCNEITAQAEKAELFHLNRINNLIDRLDNYLGSLMISSVGLLIFWQLWNMNSYLKTIAWKV